MSDTTELSELLRVLRVLELRRQAHVDPGQETPSEPDVQLLQIEVLQKIQSDQSTLTSLAGFALAFAVLAFLVAAASGVLIRTEIDENRAIYSHILRIEQQVSGLEKKVDAGQERADEGLVTLASAVSSNTKAFITWLDAFNKKLDNLSTFVFVKK